MPRAPIVAVTSTTEIIRGLPRVRVNQSYTDALTAVHLVPVVVPPIADPELAAQLLEGVSGLVLTGGEDVDPRLYDAEPHPSVVDVNDARDACELALAREAERRRIPTLAICRGIQVVNVALGGSLVQDIPSQRPGGVDHDPDTDRSSRVHDVVVERGSRLARALGTEHLVTNSFHHQALGRVAPSLCVTARAEDGIVEGVESRDDAWWMLGVQWHPEELTGTSEEWDRRLFRAFAESCSRQLSAVRSGH
jgi:putative glutamine amidotransferase